MADDFSNRLAPGAFEARLAAGPEVPKMGIGNDGRPVTLSAPLSSALRLHDVALVMLGKIDVPKTFEESVLYDACQGVIWRAQKYLKANGVLPPCWYAEPGELGFVDKPQAPR